MIYSINEKIRIIRQIRGYKQSYVAFKLNISQQDYSYLETHAKNLTNEQFSILSEILNVSETFLDQFNPDILLNKMQLKEQENSFSLNTIPNDNKIIELLNEQISLLEKNILGLRNQIKEQNETIRDLRKLLNTRKNVI